MGDNNMDKWLTDLIKKAVKEEVRAFIRDNLHHEAETAATDAVDEALANLASDVKHDVETLEDRVNKHEFRLDQLANALRPKKKRKGVLSQVVDAEKRTRAFRNK